MTNTKLTLPELILAVLGCMLSFSCAHSGSSAGGSGGAGPGAGEGGYTISDIDGDWVGVLYPNSHVLDPFNFYFSSADSGIVSEAADSKGNQWLAVDSLLTLNILNSGRMVAEFNSMIQENRLYLEGNMSAAMNEITGDYEYANNNGIPVGGTFILSRSTGNDYFSGMDYSGSWSGFVVGHHYQNMRQPVTFILDNDGSVLYGSMTHQVTGHEIHHYSVGAGSFGINLNTTTGRIDNFELHADDGAIATCDFLLLDHELTLIGGIGIDSDIGEGTMEITR